MRKVNGRGVVGAAVFVSWVGMALSSNAFAQEGAGAIASSEEQIEAEKARLLYKEGVREAGEGQWEVARQLFLKAFRLRPHFQIAFNLGQSELKVGEYIGAAEHLSFFLREAQGVAEVERRTAREMRALATREVATLVISTNWEGAEVLVDGVLVGKTPLGREVFVAPGRRVIRARLDGFSRVTEVRTVTAGDSFQVPLLLIQVSMPVAKPREAPPEGGANKAILLTGIIAGAVAAGSGVGFTLAANSKRAERDKAENSCAASDQPQCPQYNAIERTRSNFTIVAVTSYVAAGILGVGTLIYGLQEASPEPTGVARASRVNKVSATVLAGPGLAFATVTMNW